jgi:hypothetical protein
MGVVRPRVVIPPMLPMQTKLTVDMAANAVVVIGLDHAGRVVAQSPNPHSLASKASFRDAMNVNRRLGVTPPNLSRSMTCDADRRRDPTPNCISILKACAIERLDARLWLGIPRAARHSSQSCQDWRDLLFCMR